MSYSILPYLITSSKVKAIYLAQNNQERLDAKQLHIIEKLLKRIFGFTYLQNKERALELVDKIMHENHGTDFESVENKLRAFNQLAFLLGDTTRDLLKIKYYENSTIYINNQLTNDYTKSEIILNIADIELVIQCDKKNLMLHKHEVKHFFYDLKRSNINNLQKFAPHYNIVSTIEKDMLETIENVYIAAQQKNVHQKEFQKATCREFINRVDSVKEKINVLEHEIASGNTSTISDITILKNELKILFIDLEDLETPKPLSTLCVHGELITLKESLENIVSLLESKANARVYTIQDYRELSNCKSKLNLLLRDIDSYLNEVVDSVDEDQVYTFDIYKEHHEKCIRDLKNIQLDMEFEKQSHDQIFPIQFTIDATRNLFEFHDGDYVKVFKHDDNILETLEEEVIQHFDFPSDNLDRNETFYYIFSFLSQATIATPMEQACQDLKDKLGDHSKKWALHAENFFSETSNIKLVKNEDRSLTVHWYHKKPNIMLFCTTSNFDSDFFYDPSKMKAQCDFEINYIFNISPQSGISIQKLTSKIIMTSARDTSNV